MLGVIVIPSQWEYKYLLVASCNRKWDKLWPDEPLCLYADFIFFTSHVTNVQLCILAQEKVHNEYFKMENILFNGQSEKHRYPAI